jgi:hypothetical protein
MKQLAFILAFFCLCSCNTLYVAQNKNYSNTTSIGVEWNFGDFQSEQLQRKIDSVLLIEIDKFNSQNHAFKVYERKPRDKGKDYISIDIEKGKVVGTGGKIAGYALTTIGLIATPVALAALESPLIFAFYYWPQHNVTSKVTLSPALSGEKKNNKNLMVATGALFASTNNQVEKLVRKYAEGFHKTLIDVEAQLSQH